MRRDTSANAPAALIAAVAVVLVVGVLAFSVLTGSVFGPPPIEPACTLRGVTTPSSVQVEVRIRSGDGGATVAATTTSDGTGAYSVVVQCRPGTPYDAKATRSGYFDVILEALPFSTDRPTVFEWSPTLTRAP